MKVSGLSAHLTATCICKCSFAACLRVADRGRDALAKEVVTPKLTYLPLLARQLLHITHYDVLFCLTSRETPPLQRTRSHRVCCWRGESVSFSRRSEREPAALAFHNSSENRFFFAHFFAVAVL